MKNRLTIMLPLLLTICCPGCGNRPRIGQSAADPECPAAATALRPAAADDSKSGTSRKEDATIGKTPFLRNDTLFFCDRQETIDGFTMTIKVFVDSDRTSENRLRLRNISSLDSGRNRRELADNIAYLRKRHPGAFPRHELRDMPVTWLPLRSVQGELYIDELNFYPVHLTDSLLIEECQDGPWPSVYTHFEQSEAGRIHFRTGSADAYSAEGDRTFDFRLIDTLRKIAILAEHGGHAETRYRLLVADTAADRFDLLVWECSELPYGDEVPCDTLDYSEIMATGHFPPKP